MKIAFILNSFPKLSETFVINQITGLIDMGHEVKIFAFKNPSEKIMHQDVLTYNLMELVYYIEIPKNKVKRIIEAFKIILKNCYKIPICILKSLNFFRYKKNSSSLNLLFGLQYIFLIKNFDILHCHFGPNGIYAAMLKEICGLKSKVITSFHGYDMSNYLAKHGNKIYDFLFKKGDLFLPVSDYWKKLLMQLGCDEEKIVVHRMGIDLKKFKFNEKIIDKKDLKIISVGRLVEKKGIDFGIKAVFKLLEKNPDIAYSYNIIGEGPLKNKLQSLIKEYRIADKVKLRGARNNDQVLKLLSESDILLAPSIRSENNDMEGIPVVIMEAMAVGTMVISTHHSGIPELVKEGKTGFIVEERNPGEIEKKISFILENPLTVKSLRIQARKAVDEFSDINKLNKRLNLIYAKIIEC